MSLVIESRKLKRTGYLPAFLAGGALAAAFPVVYMMAKAEEMTSLSGNPLAILMSANWQMMAMLNVLVSICGACMMYHTEYADNGMQKMSALPVRQGNLFFGKFVIAALVLSAMVVCRRCSRSEPTPRQAPRPSVHRASPGVRGDAFGGLFCLRVLPGL